ncbi:MAG TPA: hypothetical protein PL098_00175 [Brevundimonas diminuta]|nr:hypothetical protein [Brevundimonas diminuta]HRL23320.1 hypothetical protein [Brevundimonas diminuta]
MRFVVGMETSGRTRDAFRSRGYDALSVDLLPAQTEGPHIQGDVFEYLASQPPFTAGVFHPDCTYHTLSAAWAFKDPDFVKYPGVGYHQRVAESTLTGAARRAARAEAEEDVLRLRYLPFFKVLENPKGTLPRILGRAHDIVQPYEFGADASKATCLWFFDENGEPAPRVLRRRAESYVKPRLNCSSCGSNNPYEAAFETGCVFCGSEPAALKPRWSNQTDSGQNNLSPGAKRWQARSDTYPGIAEGLAGAVLEAVGADLA